jgi:hypothetical protein
VPRLVDTKPFHLWEGFFISAVQAATNNPGRVEKVEFSAKVLDLP